MATGKLTTQDAAKRYIERGYAPVPIPPRSKGPVLKGWTDLRIDASAVQGHFDADSNIGILLGEPSGWLIDIDLDCEEAVELAPQYLPPTAAVTGRDSKPRSHWWYRAEGAATMRFKDIVSGEMLVELRSTGLQTVVGPSVHPDGDRYNVLGTEPAVVPAPMLLACVEALVDEINRSRRPSPSTTCSASDVRVHASGTLVRRAAAYLDRMPAAVSGQGGHNATYAAATAMAHGFGLNRETALQLLNDRYNPRCSPPWSDRELEHKVDDAISKPHERPHGWLRDADREAATGMEVRSRPAGARVDPEPPPPELPERFLEVPGFVGGLIEHDLATAIRPQPALALAAAISVQAVLAARRVRDRRGNRTNLYCIGVARTGAGKNNPLQSAQRLLAHADLARHMWTGGIASEAGLVSAVEAEPARLFLIDEVGRFLQTIGDARRSPHLFGAVSALMALYSASGGVYATKAYADVTRNKTIHQPCVSLLGMTTPGRFYESLTMESIRDGFVGRLLVFETDDLPPRRDAEEREPPQALVEAAAWWGAFQPGGNLHAMHPSPKVVDSTPDAEKLLRALGEEVDEHLRSEDEVRQALWARAEEKACRLALIYACSADRENPIIDEAAARWACDLARHTTDRVIAAAGRWIADGEFDSKQKYVLRVVRDAGGSISRSGLWRKTRSWPKREREEVIDNMQLTEQIVVESIETGGRPREVIRLPLSGEVCDA